MIPFTITDTDMALARERVLLYFGDISMQDKLIGSLGEIAVYNWINEWSPCYFSDSGSKYDLLMSDARTVEVKTMRTSTPPQPHYVCAMSGVTERWERKQDSSVWIFVHLDRSFTHGWIVAWCTSEKRDRFTFHTKGELMDSGKPYQLDTMNCPIWQLDDPARLMVNA